MYRVVHGIVTFERVAAIAFNFGMVVLQAVFLSELRVHFKRFQNLNILTLK